MNDALKLIGGAIAVALAILIVMALVAGIGAVRHESQYTGQVVDIENEKGIILQTSQAHLKTDSRSSEHETFCIHPDNREQLEPLRQTLRDGQRVTITYERPMYVPVWTCQSGTSIITDIDVSDSGDEQEP
jgi:hypothetical protein